MKTSHDFFAFCSGNLSRPDQSLVHKQGKGVFRRVFTFVPAAGEGAVNYKVPIFTGIKGSNSMHQFKDVGTPGELSTRLRSCHCPGCFSEAPGATCDQAAEESTVGHGATPQANTAGPTVADNGSGSASGSGTGSGTLREPKKPGVATPGVMSSSATEKKQSNQISGQSDSFLLAPNGESSAGSETWRANVRCASTTSRVSLLVSGR